MSSEHPSKPGLRDMFGSGVDKRRVEEVLKDTRHQAIEALLKLHREVADLKKNPETQELSKKLASILKQIHMPAFEALNKELHQAGYSGEELSAAHAVAGGMITLESK